MHAVWPRSFAVGTAMALLLTLPLVAPASAAAPDNDNYADATAIADAPFNASVDFSEASLEPDEALPCTTYAGQDRSVWYTWTAPYSSVMSTWMDGYWNAQTVAVYGPFTDVPADFAALGDAHWCVYDTGSSYSLNEWVNGGELYVFQFAIASGWSTLADFSLTLGPPPPQNDNLANAIAFDTLPWEDYPDLSYASVEPGEELCGSEVDQTAWYSYVAPADGTLAVTLSREYGTVYGEIYRPGDDTGITPAATTGGQCFYSSQPLHTAVYAGETYLFQVGTISWYGGSQPVHVLFEAGPPQMHIDVAVGPIGSVIRAGGVAFVTFSVTCNQAADFTVYTHLRQRLTRTKLADADGSLSGRCGPEPLVQVMRYADPDAAFAAGQAMVTGSAYAYDGWSSTQPSIDVSIRLRNQH